MPDYGKRIHEVGQAEPEKYFSIALSVDEIKYNVPIDDTSFAPGGTK